MSTPLPNPRRIIAGHGPDGSVIVHDELLNPVEEFGFGRTMAYIQKSIVGKSDLQGFAGKDSLEGAGMIYPGGITVSWLDLPPGYDSGDHFTNSIDYAICTVGEIKLVLHDGSSTIVKPGDLVIQLAGIHRWINESDQTARFLGIVTQAEPVTINGKTLDQEPFNVYKYA